MHAVHGFLRPEPRLWQRSIVHHRTSPSSQPHTRQPSSGHRCGHSPSSHTRFPRLRCRSRMIPRSFFARSSSHHASDKYETTKPKGTGASIDAGVVPSLGPQGVHAIKRGSAKNNSVYFTATPATYGSRPLGPSSVCPCTTARHPRRSHIRDNCPRPIAAATRPPRIRAFRCCALARG